MFYLHVVYSISFPDLISAANTVPAPPPFRQGSSWHGEASARLQSLGLAWHSVIPSIESELEIQKFLIIWSSPLNVLI